MRCRLPIARWSPHCASPIAIWSRPTPGDDDGAWLTGLDRALDAGIVRLQLRLHGVDRERRRRLVAAAVLRGETAHAEIIVNGDLALAREFGIGLHLPAAQLREHDARPVRQQGRAVGLLP